jgi:excisionase family DNA binding protein
MLTVKQVAKELAMSVTCVYQLINSGKLVSHRFGLGRGGIRVSESDLAAYIESCRKEKRPDKPAAYLKQRPLSAFKHLRRNCSPD